jgi:hypothetical protein
MVRAATRPQLGFFSFGREATLGVFLNNQSNFAYSMTISRLLWYATGITGAYRVSVGTESVRRFARGRIQRGRIDCLPQRADLQETFRHLNELCSRDACGRPAATNPVKATRCNRKVAPIAG